MNDLENLYRQRLNQFDKERKALGQKMHRLGNVRVVLFVCMVLCLLQFFSSNFQVLAWWWLFLATVPFFAYLVKVHQKIFEQKELIDQLCLINEKEKEEQNTNLAQFDGGYLRLAWPRKNKNNAIQEGHCIMETPYKENSVF